MFFPKKQRRNWAGITTAMIGGLLLGISCKKYGSTIKNQLGKISYRTSRYDENYTDNMEPDA